MFTTVYTTLVRIKLEKCVQVVSLCLKGDSDILEILGRVATRGIPEIQGLPYKKQLENLNFFSLSYSRLRANLILMYRILNNFGPNIFSLFLSTKSGHIKGQSMQVGKPRMNKISVAYRFSHPLIDPCNLLPEALMSASSIDAFKRRLDTYRSTLEKE